jgi:hypothetical protein
VSAPVGPAGTICKGDDDDPAAAPARGRAGLAVGFSRASLVFDDTDATVDHLAVVSSMDFFTKGTVTWQIAGGGFVTGNLRADRVDRQMGPGWLVSGGATWRVADGTEGAAPYVLLSLTLGATGTRTFADPPDVEAPLRGDYVAFDARFGATVGKTFADRVSPYAAARVFGGPVLWTEEGESRTGTDRYHVQLAGGVALLLDPIDLFVEGAPLGEIGVSGGIGVKL